MPTLNRFSIGPVHLETVTPFLVDEMNADTDGVNDSNCKLAWFARKGSQNRLWAVEISQAMELRFVTITEDLAASLITSCSGTLE
jgi:hypothetical protein